MSEIRKIHLGDKEVILDPDKMSFNETTLSDYMEKESGWYDYFGAMLADAEHIMHLLELEHDILYGERFKEQKENGCTEKLAEGNTKSDADVSSAKKKYLDAKHNVRLLQQHLRAWDKAHENAQSRGHFLRKEMDKLNKDLFGPKPDNYLERQLENKVDNIVKEFNPQEIAERLGL
jgi:citrate synthase